MYIYTLTVYRILRWLAPRRDGPRRWIERVNHRAHVVPQLLAVGHPLDFFLGRQRYVWQLRVVAVLQLRVTGTPQAVQGILPCRFHLGGRERRVNPRIAIRILRYVPHNRPVGRVLKLNWRRSFNILKHRVAKVHQETVVGQIGEARLREQHTEVAVRQRKVDRRAVLYLNDQQVAIRNGESHVVSLFFLVKRLRRSTDSYGQRPR